MVLPRLLVPLALGLAVTLAAPAADAARTKTVTIEDVDFSPGTVRVSRGDRVRWVWRDGPYTQHNVRSRGSRRFEGSGTKTEGTHTVRFRRRGTYRYVCTVHMGMEAKVVVR